MSISDPKTPRLGRPKTLKPNAPGRLSPVKDFGAGTELARVGVGALHGALLASDSCMVEAALEDWKRLLSQATGHDMDRPSEALAELALAYEIDCHEGTAEVAFALHTFFSLLVKLILCQALGNSSRDPLPDLVELAETSTDNLLLRQMQALDEGRLLRALRLNRPGNDGESDWDPFAWYAEAWCEPLAAWVRRAAEVIGRYDPRELRLCGQQQAGGVDLLGDLYQGLLPKKVRHALGEYYTPSWLVAHVLDGLGYCGDINTRLLDPSCGSGNFLLAAIRRIRREQESGSSELSSKQLALKITGSVVGFDLNPTAVLAAQANYLLAIGDLVTGNDPPAIPVYLRDTILDDTADDKFDYLAGNPPWIVWDNLSDTYREKTKPLWQRYGLFTLSGTAARHGGGKKDLSMLMTYVCADRHLVDGGWLGFVVTQTIFQTKGAGDGFRRFRLGENGPHLRVLRADDMVRIRPFPGAANWTGTLFLQKGCKTDYPVDYERWWLRSGRRMPEAHAADDGEWLECFERERLAASPIDGRRASSPWFVQPAELETDLRKLIGPSDYTAHLGANTGGANAVYWLRIVESGDEGVLVRNITGSGRRDRKYEAVEECIEADLI
ncbi:MAG: N-6 DNA methylase, partial [Pirellulales bacterium]|nr:N-6 DNA methylase [Pirellulales bacterium]